jgi:hypothetical protein
VGRIYTRRLVADLPVDLAEEVAARLLRSFDLEGKIPAALEALGPLRSRDVVLVDGAQGVRARQLADLGARLTVLERPTRLAELQSALAGTSGIHVSAGTSASLGVPDDSMDAIVAYWTAFRGSSPAEVAEADRALRSGGRLLVVHDYGRDDVSRIRGDLPEYSVWSRRDGWYLQNGFRMRVIHAFWTFDSLTEARALLVDAIGSGSMVDGHVVAESRPPERRRNGLPGLAERVDQQGPGLGQRIERPERMDDAHPKSVLEIPPVATTPD